MKRRQLEHPTTLFRSHNPRYAHLPTSGVGAASAGGRYNRVGLPALYLSLEEETSAAEYRQDNAIADPYTMVAYLARLPPLVDLAQLDDTWDAMWRDWDADWRQLFVDGVQPPTWVLGDMLMDLNEPGLIFPSLARPGGTNVVLFTELMGAGWLEVYDPRGLLNR